jgi:hypothetical protein
VKELKNPITLLVLILVAAAFSAPFGTPLLAAFAKDFLPAVATLVAAYAGSWYAFSLNQEAVKTEQRSKQIGNGVRAMFVLWRQINAIAQVQEDVIDKFRDYAPAPLAMPPIEHHFDDSVRLDIDGLMFFLDHGKSELLGNLCIAETRYVQAVDRIRKRSLLHANEVQPKIEGKKPSDRNLSPDELRDIIGIRLFHQLIEQTKEAIATTDDAVASLEAVAVDLHTALLSAFPDAHFPKPAPMMEPLEKSEPTERPTGLL